MSDNPLATDSPEAFALACGMTGPLEVVATHRATGATRSFAIDRPFTFIGRAQGTGVRLDDPSVSQCHAYLQVVGGVPYCVDLGSRTGVVWGNGSQGRGWVSPGQTVRIGMFDVRVGSPGGAGAAPPSGTGGWDDLPPVLEVYAPEGGRTDRHPLDRPVTLVGRHPSCDLRFMSDTVPYFQCALVGTPSGVWCVDIWSPRGTVINGRPTRLARARDGDLIEIGRASLVLRTSPGGDQQPGPTGVGDDRSTEALSAVSKQILESVTGAFATFREEMERYLESLTQSSQSIATAQQEHASHMGEQLRQVQELARELKELRADVEREGAAARVFAAAQQEHESLLAEQMRQFQELAQGFRADDERRSATAQTSATAQQEFLTLMGEQLRQVQELTQRVRTGDERESVTPQASSPVQQELMSLVAEQSRQIQELTQELKGLREDVERERAATRPTQEAQQGHESRTGEQVRQTQELIRELRADVEREGATVRALSAAQQEHASLMGEQLRQVQELVRELRAEVRLVAVTPPTPAVSASAAAVPATPAVPPPPAPQVARLRQAQTTIDTQTWSLDRLATTVQPQFGTVVRAGAAQQEGTAQADEARRRAESERQTLEAQARQAEAERAAGHTPEWRQAQIEMGNEILKSVLTDRTARLGPDHPDTLSTMVDLALGYRDAGQWEKALPLLEESLRIRTAKHGPDHPDTLAATGNLAAAYLEAKQADKSLALLESYIPKMRAHLGADTPRFAGLLAMLAYDLLAARQFAAAESYLRECLAVSEVKQPDAWITSQAKALLGGSLLGQRKYADAEPLLLAGYQGMKRLEKVVPPQGRVRLREVTVWLAELYTAAGSPEEAARWRAEGAAIAGAAPAAGGEEVPARAR